MSKKPLSHKDANCQKEASGEDLEVLQAFSEAYKYDEIEFSEWKRTHTSLDILVPIFISAELVGQEFERKVTFVRTITTKVKGEKVVKREKVSKTIRVPSNAHPGEQITIDAAGDISDSSAGRVKVILRIKK